MKTQITTADNHINQDKTDKMKNLKCYLTHTCSASKPLPVTIVACVVHLPPLPPRRLARRVKSSRITSSAGRRLAGGQRGGGGWAKSARIHSWQAGAGPGEGEPAQLCSHSTWRGRGGGVFWPDGMQPCRIPITEMGSIAGAAICLNQLGWSESNWVTVGFLLSAEKYLENIRVVKISLLPNKRLMIVVHSD